MTYQECREYIGSILDSIELDDIEDCCFQVNLIGGDNGVFYIDIRDHLARIVDEEDREYRVKYIFTPPVLSRLLKNVVDPIYAYTTGKYKMMGDIALGRELLIRLCEAKAS